MSTFEELASSLRVSQDEAQELVPLLAEKLKDELGERVKLTTRIRRSGFFDRHREERIIGCIVNLGGRYYGIHLEDGDVTASISDNGLTRGSRFNLSLWLSEIQAATAALAAEHEQGLIDLRSALTGIPSAEAKPALGDVEAETSRSPLSRPSALAEPSLGSSLDR